MANTKVQWSGKIDINLKKADVGQPKYFNSAYVHVVLTNLCSIFSIFKVFWSGHDLFWSNVEQGWIVQGFCSGLILKKWSKKKLVVHCDIIFLRHLCVDLVECDFPFCPYSYEFYPKNSYHKHRVGFLINLVLFATTIDSSKLQFANWTKFNAQSLKLKSIVNHSICTNKTTIFGMRLMFLTKNISYNVHDNSHTKQWATPFLVSLSLSITCYGFF